MLIQSHLYLASQLKKMVDKKSPGFKLNETYLKLGSIMPDILPEKRNNPHDMDSAFIFVLDKINTINAGMYKSEEHVSYMMGIIIHYLADFFCGAHNDRELNKNMWKHYKYEYKLHHTLTSVKYIEFNNNLIESINLSLWIKKKYQNYFQNDLSVVCDVLYIQEVCHMALQSLTIAVEKNKKNEGKENLSSNFN